MTTGSWVERPAVAALTRSVRELSMWADRKGRLQRLVRPLARRLRRALIRLGNPAAPYPIGGFEIDLPLSHPLPQYREAYPLYDTAVGRLARVVWDARPGSSVIDIGANVGDTAAVIRSASQAPLLCIEGSAEFAPLLVKNAARLGPAVYVETVFVGPKRATIRAHVNSARGTASLEQATDGSSVEIETLDEILRRNPALPGPGLVKVDTDGFDCPIIEGSLEFWEKHRPVLFFEYDPDYYPEWDPRPMFEGLRAIGYERALAYENVGEFAGSVPLSDPILLDELHIRYQGCAHVRYADLCLFHRDHGAVGEAFRRAELVAARRRR
ncbi:MAG TPA: FkbM family methyltransferase [Anaeromyxobacter sp.]